MNTRVLYRIIAGATVACFTVAVAVIVLSVFLGDDRGILIGVALFAIPLVTTAFIIHRGGTD